MRAALYAASAAAASAAAVELHLRCGGGVDAPAAGLSATAPLNTVAYAVARLREARAKAGAAAPATLWVSGTCAVPATGLQLRPEDGGASADAPVTWAAYPGDEPAVVSGGVTFTAADLQPIADPAVRAMLPAPGSVQQLNLTALGVTDMGQLSCHPYEGSDASILPGLIQNSAMELAWAPPAGTAFESSLVPLTMSRWPNRVLNPLNWSHVAAVSGATITPTADALPHLAGWARDLARDPQGVYLHFQNSIGWADWNPQLLSVDASAGTYQMGQCGSDYNTPAAKDYFTVFGSLFSELDSPGEYVIDRPTGMAYVWAPDAAYWATSEWGTPVVQAQRPTPGVGGAPRPARRDGDAVVGAVTVAANVLTLAGTQFLNFQGITFTSARGAGLVLNNASYITFDGCAVEAVGANAVNVTGGSNVTIANTRIQGAALGGVYLYAGDRTTLTPSSHVIVNSSLSYSHRWMFCYLPLVATGGAGHTVQDSEVYGAPHMGLFLSGNNHLIAGNAVHDVVQVVRDSGALYGGREWTYRGNVITGNTFSNINTVMPGEDVSAVYLDDSLSGITITNNLFTNISRALLLGGGRDNVFSGNIIKGYNSGDAALHVDDRDENWARGACNATSSPPGILVQFLARVPYNTSAVWIQSYAHLPNILQDDPCDPKYNVIANNSICGGTAPWIDVSLAEFTQWGNTVQGNTNATNC